MEKVNFRDFIWQSKNSLSEDFCRKCIEKFENDPKKVKGRTLGNQNLKQSTDLMISNLDNWEEEDAYLSENISTYVNKYVSIFADQIPFLKNLSSYSDTGYNIQRTYPGQGYDWHDDSFSIENTYRILTFIWYLNDINYEGETEFIDGTKIKPETGKILIFPSTWNYVHRGVSPLKETKYICTGWIRVRTLIKENGEFHYG